MIKKALQCLFIVTVAMVLYACSSSAAKQVSVPRVPPDSLARVLQALTPDEKQLLNDFKGDSIRLLAKGTTKEGAYNVTHITVIDYSINSKVFDASKDLSLLPVLEVMKENNIPADFKLQLNPFKDLNALYSQVFIYKGQLVTCNGDDEGGDESSLLTIIADSAVMDFRMMAGLYLYKEAIRSGDITRYVFKALGETNNEDTLEIKTIDKAIGLQAWKRSHAGYKTAYSLVLPIEKTRTLPMIVAHNNLGAGEGSLLIDMDRINYDSLFYKK